MGYEIWGDTLWDMGGWTPFATAQSQRYYITFTDPSDLSVLRTEYPLPFTTSHRMILVSVFDRVEPASRDSLPF
jgi:hypothetical protein